MTATLLGLPYSPWTERARWALDHHHVSYDFEYYMLLLGEPGLRIRLRDFKNKVTVPIFFGDEGNVIRDSWAIAEWADAQHANTPLFPSEFRPQITSFFVKVEAAVQAGRGLVTAATGKSQQALVESTPSFIPKALRHAVALSGAPLFKLKYGLTDADLATQRATVEALATELDGQLSVGSFVFEKFSFADILAATFVQGVKPVDNRFIHMGEGMRAAWTLPDADARFPNLIAWRDAIYETHRNPSRK